MQKILPHLWFDTQAKEAAHFYVESFGSGSAVTSETVLKNPPYPDCDVVAFTLGGYEFLSISAGPMFQLNPSVSFMVNFDPSRDAQAREHLDALWGKLSDGGKALMPLDEYPFSKRYGWVQDKFGVSWQLILTDPEGEPRPFIIPSIMFTGDNTGKADEAIDFWVSVFRDSKRGMTAPYPEGAAPEKDAKVMFADFQLEGQWFAAMDSGHMHDFTFNEAVSLLVLCKTQEEIDHYWSKLSAVKESEQCGWLKDKYGLSWQISSDDLEEMLRDKDQAAVDRVTRAFMPMKKLDMAAIRKAYEGK